MEQAVTLDDLGLEQIEVDNTSIDELDREDVNLIFLAIDISGSMHDYTKDMQKCLADFRQSLIDSKEADAILVARADFNDQVVIGGYKPIGQFSGDYHASGMTALNQVTVEGKEKLVEYMNFLKRSGVRVKAVFSIFTDGDDTASKGMLNDAIKAVAELNQKEVTTSFISFGGGARDWAEKVGFRNIMPVGASASDLRKAFDCLSKSVIDYSKSVTNDPDDFFAMN